MNAVSSAAAEHLVPAQVMRRALETGRIHHAYLFDGSDMSAMSATAWSMARALLCTERSLGQSAACGRCSACTRCVEPEELAPSRHPDLIVIARGLYAVDQIGRRTPEGTELSVDQIRAMVLPHRGFGPSEGKARVFLLYRPEELSVAAANTLLKTLEEPGADTHFILLSEQPGALLDTIRSRCLTVRFRRAPAAEQAPTLDAALLSALSGSLGDALDLADAWKKDKPELYAALDTIEQFLSWTIREQAQQNAIPARLEALADAAEFVRAARDDVDANVSPALAMEKMFFRIQRTGALSHKA